MRHQKTRRLIRGWSLRKRGRVRGAGGDGPCSAHFGVTQTVVQTSPTASPSRNCLAPSEMPSGAFPCAKMFTTERLFTGNYWRCAAEQFWVGIRRSARVRRLETGPVNDCRHGATVPQPPLPGTGVGQTTRFLRKCREQTRSKNKIEQCSRACPRAFYWTEVDSG